MSEKIYKVLFLCTANSAHSLPIDKLNKLALKREMDRIGENKP